MKYHWVAKLQDEDGQQRGNMNEKQTSDLHNKHTHTHDHVYLACQPNTQTSMHLVSGNDPHQLHSIQRKRLKKKNKLSKLPSYDKRQCRDTNANKEQPLNKTQHTNIPILYAIQNREGQMTYSYKVLVCASHIERRQAELHVNKWKRKALTQ